MPEVGDIIRAKRLALRLSQAALAKAASGDKGRITQQTVDRIERGETKFSRATGKILAALGLDEESTAGESNPALSKPKESFVEMPQRERARSSARSDRRRASVYRLDDTDLRILKRLQLDARVSNVKLAEDVHLSASACLEHTKALEAAGVISRYIAEYSLEKICSSVMLLVEVVLENHREADFEKFLAAIRNRDEVLECFKIGGRIDYLLRVICRDIAHYSAFSDFMSRGELGIEKFHGHIVLAVDKRFEGYPLDLLVEQSHEERI